MTCDCILPDAQCPMHRKLRFVALFFFGGPFAAIGG
jgi:hypothetical protein